MLRAAVSGAFDFHRFDPNDRWSLRHLRWVLQTIESQAINRAAAAKHLHWVILASHGNLTESSFATAQKNATTTLHATLVGETPWLAEQLAKLASGDSQQELIAQYYETFGRPGDARYEAMIQTLRTELSAPPRTPEQRAKDRAARRRKLAAAAKLETPPTEG